MKYIERNKSYKYELMETFNFAPLFIKHTDIECQSDFVTVKNNTLTIKAGYAWDGSSIPLKGLSRLTFGLYDPDKYCKEASLIHDAFYQLMRFHLLGRNYKYAIDRLYEKMCIDGGMNKKAAARRYWAVKHFGARTLKPRYYPEKQILET